MADERLNFEYVVDDNEIVALKVEEWRPRILVDDMLIKRLVETKACMLELGTYGRQLRFRAPGKIVTYRFVKRVGDSDESWYELVGTQWATWVAPAKVRD